MHRESFVIRIEARSFGHRPTQQHTVEFEPKIVVQAARGMLLDHIGQIPVLALDDAALGFGRRFEATLFAVEIESHCSDLHRCIAVNQPMSRGA